MAGYTIISDVGNFVLKRLRTQICPEPLLNPQSIEFVSPADENADYTLGIFLYDMKENLDHTSLSKIPIENNKYRMPPHSFTIYYMIYVNASAQISVKSLDAQKILAKVSQVMYDIRQIDPSQLQDNLETVEESARVEESRLTFDEKTKIWSALNKPMQLALYYSITPVLISSERIIDEVKVMRGIYKINERGRVNG